MEFDRDTTLLLASGAHRSGDLPEAERLYREVLEEFPDDTAVLLAMASVCFDQARLDDAESYTLHATRLNNELAKGEQLLCRLAAAKGDLPSALRHIARAHKLDLDDITITEEYVGFIRRSYWTYRPEEYEQLFSEIAAGKLHQDKLPRLVHQMLAKLIRPQLIDLIVSPDETSVEEGTIFDKYRRLMDEETVQNFNAIVNNMMQVLGAMHQQPLYQPMPASVTLRDGKEHRFPSLVDLDPFTGGTFEIIDHDGGLMHVPYSRIRTIQLGEPGQSLSVRLETTTGQVIEGLSPSFYLLTEFCQQPEVREGKRSMMRALTKELQIMLGVRVLRAGDQLLALISCQEIRFEQPEPQGPKVVDFKLRN